MKGDECLLCTCDESGARSGLWRHCDGVELFGLGFGVMSILEVKE